MLLTKEIEIKTTNKNISFYKKIINDIKPGDVVKIKTDQLPPNSKQKINVECDNCHRQLNILYHSYFRNVRNGQYYCNKCSFIRGKETSLFLYGTEHPLQNEEILKKLKNTNILKYGVEYPGQAVEIKNKIKKTCLEKYGETSYMKTNQFKIDSININLKKYGVKYPLQNDEIKKNVQQTCLERYGTKTPFESKEIKNKISQTKKLKYDDINYNNRKKYKKTCLEIFGFENPMLNIDIQNKLKLTMLNKYGVEFASQNEEIFQKMLKNGYKINKYKDLYYQGEYEYDFLEKYYNIGIKRGFPIKYNFEEKIHTYFPDFYYEKLNLIIEIKSSKWYEEHLEKNLKKQKSCQEQGYNFLFIIDKNYEVFEKLIKPYIYDKEHSWQYDIRLKNKEDIDEKLNVSDFNFTFISETDKSNCQKIKDFIEKYEWLGKMPNRPTHRFIATYKERLAGVVIMATPNQFSNLLGDNTNLIEKLISRGACASWTPKNLASSLIMWSINWMIKNTQFRIFTAYADTEAKELGTIYQACNFIYLGQKYGTEELYFDVKNYNLGWFSNRNFRRRNMYNRFAKELNIKIDWKKVGDIPIEIKNMLNKKIEDYKKSCIKKIIKPKHKYVYIKGKNKRETKILLKNFQNKNPKLINLPYPKIR